METLKSRIAYLSFFLNLSDLSEESCGYKNPISTTAASSNNNNNNNSNNNNNMDHNLLRTVSSPGRPPRNHRWSFKDHDMEEGPLHMVPAGETGDEDKG